MSKIKLDYPSGATPLDKNEMAGLIPSYITTQDELNDLEQENIKVATEWTYTKNFSDILNVTFCLDLHKKMFNEVWSWAGMFRQTQKNLGVDPQEIGDKLEQLFQNTKYWIENNIYEWDELATRFHHKLVSIHCFSNGNGRHARLMTNLLLKVNNKKLFTWGSKSSKCPIETQGTIRNSYLSALKKADNNSFSDLIIFVRS